MLIPVLATLAACGGGGDDAPVGGGGSSSSSSSSGGGSTWQAGVYQPSSNFDARCANPRPGTSDRQGTFIDENNWLRSWTNEYYLWYGEVMDRNPAAYDTTNYFDLLKTGATTPSGNPKDKFHFTYDTDEWEALSQGGIEAGYGAEFDIISPYPPRRIVVVYTEPGSPAASVLARGDELVRIDGAAVVDGNANVLNDGLFPEATNETHTFVVRDVGGAERTVNLTSATITRVPVPVVTTFTTPSGPVGYIQFNDHIATAESQLVSAIDTVAAANATDLILDLRYNGGGYLDIANELSYMIANRTLTAGRTFERLVFNDKHPNRNPFTGQLLAPTPFHTTTLGFPGTPAGQPLPSLDLDRVYIISGPGTCSASESIINGLRGVNVEVYLIGSTTCGKPYGFYPADNCGTTYFSIQFRGENAANFGDYSDGFSPANQPEPGTTVPGCSVADDYTHELGDPSEARIAAALAFRASNNQTCPAATGISQPQVSKASLTFETDESERVSKPAARLNRIVRRM